MNNFSRSNDWDDESLFDNYVENDPYEDESYDDDESFAAGYDDDESSEAWRNRRVWNSRTRRYEWRRVWTPQNRVPIYRSSARFIPPTRRPIPIRPMHQIVPVPYRGAATLDTPAGQAQVQLPSNLVHKGEYQHLQKQVKADNQALIAAGSELGVQGEQLQAIEQALAAFMARTNKRFDALRQSSLISGLIQPNLTEIKDDKGNVIKVKSSSFDLTSSLLPALLSGGFSEGSGGAGNDMMLPLLLLTTGGLGDSGDKSDSGISLPLILALTSFSGSGNK